jgi:hypothetical protein
MNWTGWLLPRPGGPWERVVEAPSLAVCHRRLLAAARRRGLIDRPRVMTLGGHPNAIRARRENGHA